MPGVGTLQTKLSWDIAQNQWPSVINPYLADPLNNISILQGVQLVSGNNYINHKLGKKLQGWIVVRKRQWLNSGTPTSYDITDIQSSNLNPNLTLLLYCTQGTTLNPVIVDMGVF